MKATDQNQKNRNTNPANTQHSPDHKSKPENNQDKTSSPYVDLDKSNFADRKHGRTNDSLGPDHEPGTV